MSISFQTNIALQFYIHLARVLCEFLLFSGFILQYSIITQYSHTLSFATKPEESLALSDLIPSALPSRACSSYPQAVLGLAKVSPVFSFRSGTYPAIFTAPCTGATRANGRRIGSLRRAERPSFIHPNSLYSVGSSSRK